MMERAPERMTELSAEEAARFAIVPVLAAYALNPQRPGFDAESLCAQEGVEEIGRAHV